MADVTVQVIAPGSLTTWGQGGWSTDAWGQTSGLGTQTNSVTVEAQLERGWGGQTWGENNWGDLSNEVAIVSGVSASLTLGPLEFAGATTGWGRQEWGALGWGISGTLLAGGQELTSSVGSISSVTGTANITPTGIELAATAVSPSIRTDVSFSVTGIEATITGGEESIGIGVPVTGSSLTTSTNSVETFSSNGWGRGEWGSFAWGVPYSVEPAGQELTSTIGNAVGFTDLNQDITGQELTSTLGNFSLKIDQDIFVNASEDQIDASVGSVTNIGTANVSITNEQGIQFTANGDAQLSTAEKKFGTASLLLDGTGDFVKSSNSDVVNDDFTIEFFAYASSFAQDAILWDNRVSNSGYAIGLTTGSQIKVIQDNTTIATSFAGFTNNSFNHVAISRSSGTIRAFVNGNLRATLSVYNNNYTGQPYYIGSAHTEANFFDGYIDEFRASTVARYTSAFTPPSSEFTVDSDTSSLLHFDGANGSTSIVNTADKSFPMSMSEGQVVPENKTAVDVSMDAITMTLGDFTLIQGTTESPTGQELTMSQGEADGVSIAEATGSEATLSINSVSISISNTPDITGISMTASIGEAVAKSWQEVDPGVNNTWSDIEPGVNNSWGDVDLAA